MLPLSSSILFPVVFLVAVASAFPGHNARGGHSSQCNTGPVQCCDKVMSSSSSQAQALLGSLGVSLDSVKGLVGSECSPITAIGTGSGAACSQQPICCANNAENGAVNFNCSPVNVAL